MTATEEDQCLYSVTVALHEAYEYFHKGTTARPGGAQDAGRGGGSAAAPFTIHQAVELVDVLGSLLEAVSTNEGRVELVAKLFAGPLFSILCALVTQPLIFAPETPPGFSLQQTFVSLRLTALKAVEKIIIVSATMPHMAARCLTCFSEQRVVQGMMHLLSSPATFETLRVGCIEATFVWLLRIPGAKKLFLTMDGVPLLLNCMLLEPSTTVRNFICSTLREIAGEHGAEIGNPPLVSACLKLIAVDESADVRTLCLETLEQCLRANTRLAGLLEQPADLLATLKDRFERDNAPSVAEAAARFLETLLVAAKSSGQLRLFEVFLSTQCYRSLIGVLRAPVRTAAAAAARALRSSIQLSPCQLQLGHRIVTQFQSLSALLKAAMDLAQEQQQQQQQPGNNGEANEAAGHVLRVELGIAISLLFAQSPLQRQHVYHELHAFPMWTTTLRGAVLGFLNSAALDYYASVDVVDVTGADLTSLAGVEWGDGGKPRKSSIRALFAAQERRVREQRFDAAAAPPLPLSLEHELRRKMRLAFILLSYAVHLALSPEGVAAESGGATAAAAAAAAASEAPSALGFGTPRGAASALGAPTELRGPDQTGAGASPGVAAGMGNRAPSSAAAAGWAPSFVDPAASATALFGARQGSTARSTTAGAAAAAASPGGSTRMPMFPTLARGGAGVTPGSIPIGRTNFTPREREEMAIAYDRFDSAFKLTLQFAELYTKREAPQAEYEPTPDGFVVRKQLLRNPWGPIVQKEKLKSWTVRDLQPGDLFYFAIPFDDLNLAAVQIVAEKCQRHLGAVRTKLVTTPQAAKGRRWMLYDLIHSVLPRTLELLSQLRSLVETHGGDNVRFPLFLFREKEMHLGERALHSGNIVDVVDQVRYYFAQNPTEVLGVNAAYVQQVEDRIRHLAQEQYRGDDAALSDAGSDVDAFRNAPGHGDLSSESEADDFEPPGRTAPAATARGAPIRR